VAHFIMLHSFCTDMPTAQWAVFTTSFSAEPAAFQSASGSHGHPSAYAAAPAVGAGAGSAVGALVGVLVGAVVGAGRGAAVGAAEGWGG
jgi:hypothetical protein